MEHPFLVEEYMPAQAHDATPKPLGGFGTAMPPEALPALPPFPNLPVSEALLLTPADPHYADYLPAANLRTQLAPALRAVCKNEHAVGVMTDWVRSNNLSFAVRCGGHSYEGFSQSSDVVIDLRGLQSITVDTNAGLVTVGAGVSLYDVYQKLAHQGYAFPAGSCPTVGIAGHVLGGGYGLLARSHGLTCDNLQQATIINAQGSTLQTTATVEPDLFWACRGGGGGSFGIATQFVLRIFPLTDVLVFGISWMLSQSKAARVFRTWQSWAPNSPNSITSIMKVEPGGNGLISLRCIGQSIGSSSELSNELAGLAGVETPSSPLRIQMLSFLNAVKHFAGPLDYESVYMKAKSDYVLNPLAPSAIAAMLGAVAAIPVGGIALSCNAYGGTISDVAVADTAFPRRGGTQYCIQYFSSWQHPGDSASHLANLANVHGAMRPYLSGAAYVNYCDLDLQNWADAYWGANLPRLCAIKKAYDPNDLFHHAQSVPVAPRLGELPKPTKRNACRTVHLSSQSRFSELRGQGARFDTLSAGERSSERRGRVSRGSERESQ
jgi:FAD/FMN-containing dehydrogenase